VVQLSNGNKSDLKHRRIVRDAGAGGSTWTSCRVEILKFNSVVDLMIKAFKKSIPYVCEAAIAAGIAAKTYCRLKCDRKLDAECIRLDLAIEDCARKANLNYKVYDFL